MRPAYRTDHGTTIRIEEIAYHRNGVGGNGFSVLKFTEGRDRKLAIVFPGRGNVAVFDRALLADDAIAWTVNSWRGDRYEHALRDALKAADQMLNAGHVEA